MSGAAQLPKSRGVSSDLRSLTSWTIASAQYVLLSLSILMVARRVLGAATQPLSGGWLVAVAIVVASFAVISRWCQRQVGNAPPGWPTELVWWIPTATMASLAIGLTLPGVSIGAVVAFMGIFFAEELFSLTIAGRYGLKIGNGIFRPSLFWGRKTTDDRRAASNVLTDAAATNHESSNALEEEFSSDETVTQKVVRTETEEGEMTHALLRSVLPSGQQTSWMHLAFCPPLRELPAVDVEQVEGPDATIRVGQILMSGVRLDIRLREVPSRQQRITVELFAHSRSALRK